MQQQGQSTALLLLLTRQLQLLWLRHLCLQLTLELCWVLHSSRHRACWLVLLRQAMQQQQLVLRLLQQLRRQQVMQRRQLLLMLQMKQLQLHQLAARPHQAKRRQLAHLAAAGGPLQQVLRLQHLLRHRQRQQQQQQHRRLRAMKLLQLPHMLLQKQQQRQALRSARHQAGTLLLPSHLCPVQRRLLAPGGSASQLLRSLLQMTWQ
jgi:hypothetical protein